MDFLLNRSSQERANDPQVYFVIKLMLIHKLLLLLFFWAIQGSRFTNKVLFPKLESVDLYDKYLSYFK